MHWRTKFLVQATQLFALPPLAIYACCSTLGYRPNILVRVLISVASIVVYIQIKSWWRLYRIERNAASIGARTIPIAKGKWPGNLDLFIRITQGPKQAYAGSRIYDFFREYHTNTINLRPLGMDLIVTRDHGVMKEMLTTGFGRWEKGPRQRQVLGDFFGKGIIGVDGDEWKMHRAMTRPYLSKERISDFDIFWKHTQSTIEILEDISRSDIPVVDVQDLMARFTMDSASEFLFGKCLETLKCRLPIAGKAKMGVKGSAYVDVNEGLFGDFATAFESAQIILSLRSARGQLWPLFEMFGNKCAPHMRIINSYLDPIIEKAREEHKEKTEISKSDNKAMYNEEPTNLLEELVKSIDDPVVLRDELLNMLLAGRDTVASLLTFTLYMLSQHPTVEEKLRAEINQTWVNQEVQPTYVLVKKMRYMRAVLDETLRLFPPVGINHRTSSCDTTLPPTDCEEDLDKRPYYVPADTQVTYSTLVMQRSEALWGSDAGEWKPDRWMDAKEAAKHNANFEFVPFNAGPRICIGLNLAYNEASFMLTVLLSKFRFHFAPEYQPQGSAPLPEWKKVEGAQMNRVKDEKIWPLSSVTLYVKGGLWMRVDPLDSCGELACDTLSG